MTSACRTWHWVKEGAWLAHCREAAWHPLPPVPSWSAQQLSTGRPLLHTGTHRACGDRAVSPGWAASMYSRGGLWKGQCRKWWQCVRVWVWLHGDQCCSMWVCMSLLVCLLMAYGGEGQGSVWGCVCLGVCRQHMAGCAWRHTHGRNDRDTGSLPCCPGRAQQRVSLWVCLPPHASWLRAWPPRLLGSPSQSHCSLPGLCPSSLAPAPPGWSRAALPVCMSLAHE